MGQLDGPKLPTFDPLSQGVDYVFRNVFSSLFGGGKKSPMSESELQELLGFWQKDYPEEHKDLMPTGIFQRAPLESAERLFGKDKIPWDQFMSQRREQTVLDELEKLRQQYGDEYVQTLLPHLKDPETGAPYQFSSPIEQLLGIKPAPVVSRPVATNPVVAQEPAVSAPQTQLPPEIQQTLPQSQAPSPVDQIQQGLGFQSGGPQPPESPGVVKDEPLSIESILSDISNIITSNPVQDILEKPKAKVESLPVIEDLIKQQPIWKPTIGSKGERWLPDGSLILENGKIMQPNGRVVDPQTGERSAQDAGMINRSVEAAGGRPPIVNGVPNLEGLKDLPVFGDKPSVTGTEPVFDLSKILQNGDGLPKNGQVASSQGQSSSSGGKIGEGSGNILDIFKNLGFGKPEEGSNAMGWFGDTFKDVLGGLEKAGDWLSGPGGQALSTAAGGAATIYNINQQKEAAEKMAAAMDNATAQQKAAYDQTRADLTPYRLSPTAASNAAGFSTNGLPSVSLPTDSERGSVLDTSKLTDPSQAIYGGVGNVYTPTLPTTEGLPDYANFEDPAYKWMQQEGMRNIKNAGAASGRLDSGTTLERLNEMGVGLAGAQMGKVAQMRAQLFGERESMFDRGRDWRKTQVGEEMDTSKIRFGQMSDREKMQTAQQLTQFEQSQLLSQGKLADALMLRKTLFGEQLNEDEQDFLQKYNMAVMGSNAAAGMGNLAMQNAGNLGNLAMAGGAMNAQNASSRSMIINDFIKSLFA